MSRGSGGIGHIPNHSLLGLRGRSWQDWWRASHATVERRRCLTLLCFHLGLKPEDLKLLESSEKKLDRCVTGHTTDNVILHIESAEMLRA